MAGKDASPDHMSLVGTLYLKNKTKWQPASLSSLLTFFFA